MGIDILVPVLERPQSAQPLVDSAQVTQTHFRLIFICSPHDRTQIAACTETGCDTWVVPWAPGKADFAKKINYAYEHCDNEWVFQGADDIRFSPDWDTAALQLAKKTGRRVIGTNDLHNPTVKRGLTSTHLLFARSYIEEYGGTTDDSGKVFCVRYDHQYVDSEFVETAKARKEWAFCRQSVVEHLHPHWGLAESDKTYRKALRSTGHDHRLYKQRVGRRR